MKADLKISAFLANVPMFRDASPDELARIEAGTAVVHAERGHVVFQRGDPPSGFHIVVYGQVKLGVSTGAGADKVIEILGPGATFGEAVMFLDKPYPVYAQTLEDSLLLRVSQAAVFDELDRSGTFARKMLAGLSQRLHALLADVEAYSLRSGTQRVIGYLMREDDQGEARSAPFHVTLPITKHVLASRLNLTPQHFSRILAELTEAGLITVDGRVIRVLDPARLRAYEATP